MAYFSNGTEGDMYQERWCHRCAHWSDEAGCPVWFLHELHVGEREWRPALTPGQQKGLDEWKARQRRQVAPTRDRGVERLYL